MSTSINPHSGLRQTAPQNKARNGLSSASTSSSQSSQTPAQTSAGTSASAQADINAGPDDNPLSLQTDSMATQGRSQVLRSRSLSSGQQSGTGGTSGIMDLSAFNLMLPTGQQGNPDTIQGDQLSSYPSEYFQRANGQMKFFTPVTGVHSANSEDPRTELAQAQGWKLDSGPHSLSASLTLDQVPSTGDVTIGQVHQRDDVGRPPIMINWKNEQVVASVMETNSPSTQRKEYVLADNVPVGTPIHYKVDVAPDGEVAIDLNGKPTSFKLDSSFNDGELYFKAGLYVHDNQGSSTEGARATFTELQIDQETGASDAPADQASDASASPSDQTEQPAKK